MRKATRTAWFEILDRVGELIQTLGPHEPVEVSMLHAYVLSIYVRCSRLYEGVVLLLKDGLAEEALILARSLFTESLRLMQLANADDGGTAMVLGWANRSIEEMKRLLYEAASIGWETDLEDALKRIGEKQRKILGFAERHKIAKLGRFRPEKDAAIKLGRGEDYWTYLLAHHMVHGSDAAHIYQRGRLPDGSVGLFSRTVDRTLLGNIGAFAGRSMLLGARAAGRVLGWPEARQVVDLLEELCAREDVEDGKDDAQVSDEEKGSREA